jgi:hypothetical protein
MKRLAGTVQFPFGYAPKSGSPLVPLPGRAETLFVIGIYAVDGIKTLFFVGISHTKY